MGANGYLPCLQCLLVSVNRQPSTVTRRIVHNNRITLERYQVKVDKASKIRNDPNDWSREVGNPRYIIDLLARIVTVSLETMTIVDALPKLDVLVNQQEE